MQQVAEGTVQRNRRTGETRVFQGGQWVPQGSGAPALPTVIEGPPREPTPQTPTNAARDDVGLEADRVNLALRQRELNQGDSKIRGEGIDRITGFRKEFESLEPVKTYRSYLPVLSGAIQAPDNAQGDLSVLISFSKAMDPTTGVKEGETAMAQATASQLAQAEMWVRRVQEGQRLPPEVRKQFIETMRRKGAAFNQSYQSVRDQYGNLADRYGFNRDEIVGNHAGDPFRPTEEKFVGRNVVGQEDGQQPLPGAVPPPKGPGEADPSIAEMTPEQNRAYAEFWKANPNPSPEQLSAFLGAIGVGNVGNASDIIEAARSGRGYSTAVDREQLLRQEIARNPALQDSDQETLVMQGATLGLSDEAAGVGRGLSKLFQGENPVEGYRLGRDAARLRASDARQNLGAGGTALEIGGGLASGNLNALAQAPALIGRMAQGAKAGAAGGLVGGFGYGEGMNSLLTAGAGAAGGAALGGVVPLAGEFVGNRVQQVRRLTGKDPSLPRKIISQSIEADGNTPALAGQVMDDARGRGSPMMLADTGENTRALLGSVSRQQGGSKAIGRNAVIERQKGQSERISEAVVRDLGPTANISEMADELVERARAASRPHYERFEAAPGASIVKMDDLATRPAFRRALKKAVDLSMEEGADPRALGFRLNDAGEMVLDNQALSWKAMDYMKRALDDVIEGSKDQRGKLTEAGRAALGTKKTLVARMDKINPAYAEARKAYAGPVQMRDAMEKGVKALSKSPDNIMAEMKGLGDSELESYRLGVRKAIIDLVNSKRDGGDKVAHLLGTPKSRAALSRIFGGKKEFERFIQTLQDEEAMGLTYKAVATGSPTAERMATDAATNDAGLAETAFDAALRGGQNGLSAMAVAGIQRLRDVGKFGAGEAGERTRESIAALLTETDPKVLRELIIEAQKAMRQQKFTQGRRSRNAKRVGRAAGNLTGMGAGRLTEEPR